MQHFVFILGESGDAEAEPKFYVIDCSRFVNTVAHNCTGRHLEAISLYTPFSNIKQQSGASYRLTLNMKLFQALYNVSNFRTAFDFGGREVAHWFPGHMAKGDCQ